MARGRRTSLTIGLTAKERQTLLAWQRSITMPAKQARRGRVILLVARGVPITQLAATVGVSRRFVYKWVQRFLQAGLAGLADQPGRGPRPGPRPRALLEPPKVQVG
jgi:transposase